MLLQIRDYICQQKRVSSQQLTREFHMDLPALQPLLDLWVSKGVIQKCQEQKNCQSACFKCGVRALDYYEYL